MYHFILFCVILHMVMIVSPFCAVVFAGIKNTGGSQSHLNTAGPEISKSFSCIFDEIVLY